MKAAPILSQMDSLRQNNARASLSWRLTTREKYGIVENINSPANLAELQKLKSYLINGTACGTDTLCVTDAHGERTA